MTALHFPPLRLWPYLCCLFALSIMAPSLPGQSQAAVAPAIHLTTAPTTNLDGPWRYHTGDNPVWADPNFDDSRWPSLTLDTASVGTSIPAGFVWYRLSIPVPITSQPFDLLLSNDDSGELAVYLNGIESGHTRGLSGNKPNNYWVHPFSTSVLGTRPDTSGRLIIAIRGWTSAESSHGPLTSVQLGPHQDIQDKLELATSRLWYKYALSILLGCVFFLGMAILGATLYIAQRHHSEYLWLTLLCLSLTLRSAVEFCGLTAQLPSNLANILDQWAISLFILTTLEFLLRFTGSGLRIPVRTLQAFSILIPLFTVFHLDAFYDSLSTAMEIFFCLLAAIMLIRAWRSGRNDVGIMLPPFLLAAAGNSIATVINYAVTRNWISHRYTIGRFYIGPVGLGLGFFTYQIFLISLIAVILYRFIRVSQEEQRSAAEIEAARAVQALLVPTHLPSGQNFVLDSAYLPAYGVGGDFFQVLPLKDDSIMLVAGDVSGKGLQAAMSACTLVGALRNEPSNDPATILAHLNAAILGQIAGFATCLCARLYPDGRMTIANAGHLSPYRDGREMEIPSGIPLGLIPGAVYEQEEFQLKSGERLTVLSDGVIEATNAHGELFGFERTQQISNEPPNFIAQTALRFGQIDDITVVSLYYIPA